MPKLVITLPGRSTQEVELVRTPFAFGRDPDADLPINTPFLSRLHGRITLENGRYVVGDLGSTNGTLVNGSPVLRHVLAHGDVIQVRDLRLRFVDDTGAARSGGRGDTDLLLALSPAGSEAQRVENVMQSYSLRLSVRSGAAAPAESATEAAAAPIDPDKASRMFFLLFQISKELFKATSMDELLSQSLKLVFDVINAERGLLLLRDRGTDQPSPHFAYHKDIGFINAMEMEASSTVVRRAIDEKVALLTSDALSDPRFARGQSIVQQSIRSILCVPLWDETETYGALYLDNQSRTYAFTEDDRALLTGIANLIAVRWRQERLREQLKQEEDLRALLSKYHAPDVVDVLVRRQGRLEIERREVTVVFADVQDSTALAERLGEVEVYRLLNDFYEIVADAVFLQRGHINKYIGDAVLAVFNAPLDVPDHEIKAVECARAIIGRLRSRDAEKPDVPLRVRIGINTGIVVAGPVGRQQLEYTVIGDAVNVADRIMKVERASPVAVGDSTWKRLRSRYAGRDLGELALKGRDKPMRVYELVL